MEKGYIQSGYNRRDDDLPKIGIQIAKHIFYDARFNEADEYYQGRNFI